MSWLPISINCENKQCIIVGGGETAIRKYLLLREFGAKIHILAPELNEQLATHLKQDHFIYHQGTHQDLAKHYQGCLLIIAATDSQEANKAISDFANEHGILVNVVDNLELSSYITPAIIHRDPVTVAINTAGSSPILATTIREKIEKLLPMNLGSFASHLKIMRDKLTVNDLLPSLKRRFQKKLVDHFFANAECLSTKSKLKTFIEQDAALIEKHLTEKMGEVQLVGAGPGDPELITIKAMRALQTCDVILYDNLVNPNILRYARRDAEQIYVGKKLGDRRWTQDKINHLLNEYAQQGKMTVRLKGGDPLIFGRANEESEFLMKHNIPFQVIPGITAALGCAASLKLSLTHRDFAHGCIFVSAYLADDAQSLNWPLLATSNKTLVFYMGATRMQCVCDNLMQHGLAETTAMAIVENGTLDEEKIYYGNINYFSKNAENLELKRPSLLIIGDVLKLFKGTPMEKNHGSKERLNSV